MSRMATTSSLDLFLREAYKQFNLYRSEKEEGGGGSIRHFGHNKFYLDVPVRLSRDQMASYDAPAGDDYELTNALIFLTGDDSPYTVPFQNQSYADEPSVSFIVGQYGMGKTELVLQVCQHLEGSDIDPLPVNLGLCRPEVGRIGGEAPTGDEFAKLLFERILGQLRPDVGYSFVQEELLPRIRRGEVMLLLDGLDELISTRVQHRNFFRGLRNFLKGGMGHEDELLSKVVVSMRLEYLSSFAPSNGAVELVGDINPEDSPDSVIPTYFLVIDYLGDSHIKSYLDARLGAEDAFKKVKNNGHVLDMLRRPLMLKLVCDLAGHNIQKFSRILRELKKWDNPASLIENFVTTVSPDRGRGRQLEPFTGYTWDNKLLADKSLDIYRSGREPRMSVDDIRDFLRPTQGERDEEVIKALETEVVLKSIHKCPFLRHEHISVTDDSAHVVHFAHRVFFEYFTAKAISEELNDDAANSDATERRERAFDELVLNVDMRKFLRWFVPEEKWFAETKNAYGLNDRKQWKMPEEDDEYFDFLDAQRKTLLKSMTHPESPPSDTSAADWFRKIKDTVEWFLGEEEKYLESEAESEAGRNHWLHPRYLIYNYEAVAVYLWYHRWEADTRITSERFNSILSRRLDKTMPEVCRAHPRLQKPYELLLERILHIGQKLRYPWAYAFNEPARQRELLRCIVTGDENLVKRIKDIFEDIKNSTFLGAA